MMRRFMMIVEAADRRRLFEAAGTYGFFRPSDENEILCDSHYTREHADYVIDQPEAFGLTADEVEAALNTDDAEPDPHTSERMRKMTRILALVMSKGWVRVNYYRGAWSFQASSKSNAVAALRFYFENNYIEEANLDWGEDPARPIESISLYPDDQVKRFIRTGRKT